MRGHAGAVGLLVVCVDRGNGTDRLDSGGAWSSFEAGLCAKGSHGVSPWVVVTFKKRSLAGGGQGYQVCGSRDTVFSIG